MASVVCFCRDSDLVHCGVFGVGDDIESDHEKCMGTKNLGAVTLLLLITSVIVAMS